MKEHGRRANGKGIGGIDDCRTRRRDGEIILDECHQAKSMFVCIGHQRLAGGEDLHVQANAAGERKDSIVKKNQEAKFHGRVARS